MTTKESLKEGPKILTILKVQGLQKQWKKSLKSEIKFVALRLKSGSRCFQPEQELTRLTLSPELLFGLTMTGLPRYIIGPALQMFVSMTLATGIHDYQDKKSREYLLKKRESQ